MQKSDTIQNQQDSSQDKLQDTQQNTKQDGPKKALWGAVLSLFLGVTSLIAAEFLPVSLLTLIAQDLHISEGLAGQSVTAVGIFAVTTSLLLAPLTKTINRRIILITLSILLIVANILVAIAPNFSILLIGRCILGICVGGFWSMSSAVALRLVPQDLVPRALSIIYSGVAVATILAMPVASYLAQFIGWRDLFWLASLLGLISLLCQFFSLPSMPVFEQSRFRDMGNLLKTNWVITGLIAMIFSYGGYHVFFTYLRPFLENDLMLHANSLSLVLLGFGLANCIGTFIAGFILQKSFKFTMISIHIILFLVALTLLLTGHQIIENIILVMVWGFVFGIIPVAWSTWIVRTLANKAEIAGGLMVAAIQFSITLGAAVGGYAFDKSGINSVFLVSMLFLSFATLMIILSFYQFYTKVGRHV